MAVEDVLKRKVLRIERHPKASTKSTVVQLGVGTVFVSSRLGFDGQAECYQYMRENLPVAGDNPEVVRG